MTIAWVDSKLIRLHSEAPVDARLQQLEDLGALSQLVRACSHAVSSMRGHHWHFILAQMDVVEPTGVRPGRTNCQYWVVVRGAIKNIRYKNIMDFTNSIPSIFARSFFLPSTVALVYPPSTLFSASEWQELRSHFQ